MTRLLPANNIDSVWPFEHVYLPTCRGLATTREQREEYRNADQACRLAMEGPRETPEVPGAEDLG